MTPSEVSAKRRSDRLRQVALGVGGVTTLAAAGLAGAAPAARFAVKRGLASRESLKPVLSNAERNKKVAGALWLGGSVPSGVSSLSTTRSIQREIRSEDRQSKADRIADVVASKSLSGADGVVGSFRSDWTVVKSDGWRDHVSPSAEKGYRELRSGAKSDRGAVPATLAAVGAAAATPAAVTRAYRDGVSPLKRGAYGLVPAAAVLAGAKAVGDYKRQLDRSSRWDEKADKIRAAGRRRMVGRRDDGPVAKMGVQQTPRPTNGVAVRRSSNASYPGPSNNMTERRGALVRRTRRA